MFTFISCFKGVSFVVILIHTSVMYESSLFTPSLPPFYNKINFGQSLNISEIISEL